MMPVGIGILGMVFLAGLFGILGAGFVLLFRRGTWPIGLVLIGFPVVVVLLGIGLFSASTVSYQHEARARSSAMQQVHEAQAEAMQQVHEAQAEAHRRQLEAERHRIEETHDRIVAPVPESLLAPKHIEIVIDDEAARPPKPAKPVKPSPEAKTPTAKPETVAVDPAETIAAEPVAAKTAPADVLEATTVPVNSVTTFGLIVRALANAIDSELPKNISGDEAMAALEQTVNEELPAGTSRSGLISMLGKAIGKAVAEKHEETSVKGNEEQKPAAPEWIEQSSGRVGGVYQTVVKVGPFTTDLECEKAMPAALETAVHDYVGLFMNDKAQAAGVSLPRELIEERIVVRKHQQWIDSSVGPMVQLYVLVQFDGRTNEMLKEEWKNVEIRDRLIVSGLGFGAVLLIIAAAYGVLRLDLATDGKARGRLALAVVAIAVLLGFLIPRLMANLDHPAALDEATDILSISTVSETTALEESATHVPMAGETAVVGSTHATRASWAVVLLSVLTVVGVALCFRAGTRRFGIAVLIFCGILFGTGLLLVA